MAILLISLLHFHLLLHTKIVKTLGMPSCFLIKWTHKEIPDCKTTSLPILSLILPNSIYWFKWSSNLKKDFALKYKSFFLFCQLWLETWSLLHCGMPFVLVVHIIYYYYSPTSSISVQILFWAVCKICKLMNLRDTR